MMSLGQKFVALLTIVGLNVVVLVFLNWLFVFLSMFVSVPMAMAVLRQ